MEKVDDMQRIDSKDVVKKEEKEKEKEFVNVRISFKNKKITILDSHYHTMVDMNYDEVRSTIKLIGLFIDKIFPVMMQNGFIEEDVEQFDMRYDMKIEKEFFTRKDIYKKL